MTVVDPVPAAHSWATNAHLIADVARLGYIAGHVIDVTYGRGRWWTLVQPDQFTAHDLRHLDGVDFRALPHPDQSADTIALDPPYKLNGTPALNDFDHRYGVDVAGLPWQAKHAAIREGVTEAARVLRPGGHLLLKCQDQVCSGQVRWQTIEFAVHAESVGFRLRDRFDLLGGGRRQPAGRSQQHAHGRPSTLLVFVKDKTPKTEGRYPMTSATTVVGNLVRDPELRFTPAGSPVATFGVAVNRRWKNRNDEWEEQVSFFNVTCWRDLAQNVADTLQKGARVMVTGRLEQRSWETNNGDKRSVVEIVADDVGPSLRWATASVMRNEREDRVQSGGGVSGGGEDPWGSGRPAADEEPF